MGDRAKRLTYVDNVSLLVHHDVAIVSVLDLEEEPDDGVGGHGSNEIPKW